MPGFSTECQGGIHNACMEAAGSCRCSCHPWTQALLRAGPAKPSGKGGIRRNLKKNITAAVAALPQIDAPIIEDSLEVKNTCPKCKAVYKETDAFCRKDGTKLCVGKPCNRCAAPCEESDEYCFACGWKLSETPPPPPAPEPLPMPGLSLTPTINLPPGALTTEERILPQGGHVEVMPLESNPPEDPFLRLKRQAREQGLLPKETVVG